jgi:acylphosphatase
VRVRVVVHGRVQGVGFRQQASARARTLALGGWIVNRPDGAVEAAFEGPADLVASMVAWCHRGPSGARVVRVEEHSEPPVGDREFRIEFAQHRSG